VPHHTPDSCVAWCQTFASPGFSYGDPSDLDHNEAEVSRDMYNFLQVHRFPRPAFNVYQINHHLHSQLPCARRSPPSPDWAPHVHAGLLPGASQAPLKSLFSLWRILRGPLRACDSACGPQGECGQEGGCLPERPRVRASHSSLQR
jgi:hypothetical protein